MGITDKSRKFLDKVEALRKAGMTAKQACAKLGKKDAALYYKLRSQWGTPKRLPKKLPRFVKRPQVVDIMPVQPIAGRVTLVTGTASEIANILRGLTQ